MGQLPSSLQGLIGLDLIVVDLGRAPQMASKPNLASLLHVTRSQSYSEVSISSASSAGGLLFLAPVLGFAPPGPFFAGVEGVAVPCDIVSADD